MLCIVFFVVLVRCFFFLACHRCFCCVCRLELDAPEKSFLVLGQVRVWASVLEVCVVYQVAFCCMLALEESFELAVFYADLIRDDCG